MQTNVCSMHQVCEAFGLNEHASFFSFGRKSWDNVPSDIFTELEGEVALCYGGWSLKELRASKLGNFMHAVQPTWYERYNYRSKSGCYRLAFRMPDADHLDEYDQAIRRMVRFPRHVSLGTIIPSSGEYTVMPRMFSTAWSMSALARSRLISRIRSSAAAAVRFSV